MFEIESMRDFKEHLAYMIIYCPDFPYRDFLSKEDQMTLDKSFELLKGGLDIVCKKKKFFDRKHEFFNMCDRSYSAFKVNDLKTAIKLLTDLDTEVFHK